MACLPILFSAANAWCESVWSHESDANSTASPSTTPFAIEPVNAASSLLYCGLGLLGIMSLDDGGYRAACLAQIAIGLGSAAHRTSMVWLD